MQTAIDDTAGAATSLMASIGRVGEEAERLSGDVTTFLDEVRSGCRSQGVDYLPLRTDQDVGPVLSRYLAHRAARRT